MTAKSIAKAIAEYLKENGITQAILCKKTGLSIYCISSALKYKRKFSIDEYVKICIALNVMYDFFYQKAYGSCQV